MFIVKHGSIAIDGISLTIFDVKKNIFSLNIIPFTFNNTNLHLKRTGSKVNIEFDIVVKFLKNHANDSKL